MKSIFNIKPATLILFAFLLAGCSSWKGSANDTTGTNGATNGTGKIAKSDRVHSYDTK